MTQRKASPNYLAMAEFRYQIRRFLHFSEHAARAAELEPQQHQLLLALKGLPANKKPTIGILAERLQIQHHSAVELVGRLAVRGLVRRYRSKLDRRQVYVRLTHRGEEVLRKLSLYHLEELRSVGVTMVQVLSSLIADAGKQSHASTPDATSASPELMKKTGN